MARPVFLLFILFPCTVLAHGGLIFPHIWQDSGRVPLNKMRLPLKFLETSVSRVGGPMMISKLWEWFTNDTHIPEKPVTPSWMLANPGIRNDNPWQAPGTAPVFSPCGVNGGNPKGCLLEKTSGQKDPGVHCTLTTEPGVMGKRRRNTIFQTPLPPAGEWVQSRRWLGSLEGNMLGATLTDYAHWENRASALSQKSASSGFQ